MKLLKLLTFAAVVHFLTVASMIAQTESRPHATFSAFTTAPHPGIIYEVQTITSFGQCATVQFNEIHVPGVHLAVLVDYEEHLSIAILSEEFQYIDAINQFGERVPAVFFWQNRTFESVPCPIQYIVAPPSFLLYEAPGAKPIVNTSNRAEITPELEGIAGFILNESSWVVIRGMGTTMHLENGYLKDPVLTLHADQFLLDDFNDDTINSITNDNWKDTLRRDTLEFWELEPEDPNEAALVTYLYPGAYTAHITSKDESGQGLVDVFIIPYTLPIHRIGEPE